MPGNRRFESSILGNFDAGSWNVDDIEDVVLHDLFLEDRDERVDLIAKRRGISLE